MRDKNIFFLMIGVLQLFIVSEFAIQFYTDFSAIIDVMVLLLPFQFYLYLCNKNPKLSSQKRTISMIAFWLITCGYAGGTLIAVIIKALSTI